MHMKTFEGHTLRDAIKAVKAEFGQDAVILSSKETYDENLQSKRYEVVASPTSHSKRVGASLEQRRFEQDATLMSDRLGALDTRLTQMIDYMPQRKQLQHVETSLHELKLMVLEQLRRGDKRYADELPQTLADILQELRLMGLSDPLLAQLIPYLKALPEPVVIDQQVESLDGYYRTHATKWLMKRIKISPSWMTSTSHGVDGPYIHVIMGASGSGKTSVIAKLAAHFKLREKQEVLVVSMDHQRIAAHEQLRVYAKMLDVPFVHIHEPSALRNALSSHADARIILVDTSGRSLKDASLTDLKEFRDTEIPFDAHLCIPVSEKDVQQDRAVQCFAPIGIKSLIYTKLDDVWAFGDLINTSQRWSLPVSYLSTGTAIPEDIERASRDGILSRIIGNIS